MESPVRSGTPPPRRVSGAGERGGGAERVDRGKESRPLHSAELRSLRDQPPASARATCLRYLRGWAAAPVAEA